MTLKQEALPPHFQEEIYPVEGIWSPIFMISSEAFISQPSLLHKAAWETMEETNQSVRPFFFPAYNWKLYLIIFQKVRPVLSNYQKRHTAYVSGDNHEKEELQIWKDSLEGEFIIRSSDYLYRNWHEWVSVRTEVVANKPSILQINLNVR